MKEGTTMTDFWRDLVLTAMHNMSVTLGTVLPSILAMLTLVVLGALLGWIAGTIVSRLALALGLDQRSRTWGITSALARAGIYRPPSQGLRARRPPPRAGDSRARSPARSRARPARFDHASVASRISGRRLRSFTTVRGTTTSPPLPHRSLTEWPAGAMVRATGPTVSPSG